MKKTKEISKANCRNFLITSYLIVFILFWICAIRLGSDIWAWCVKFHLAMGLCCVHLSGVDYLLIQNGELRNRLEQPREQLNGCKNGRMLGIQITY